MGTVVVIICLQNDQERFMSYCCASVSLSLRVGITVPGFLSEVLREPQQDVAIRRSTVCLYPPCARTLVQSCFEMGLPKTTP